MNIRALATIAGCRQVAALGQDIRACAEPEELTPAAVLILAVKRGGILLGAFDEQDRLVGFVHSTPATKDGQLTQWSHALEVAAEARSSGVALALKLAQRDAALLRGIELVEWTFDPLHASDAEFNFARLGVIVHEYEADLDRFVAEWHLRRPHVERRIGAAGPVVRDGSVTAAPVVNPSRGTPGDLSPGSADLAVDARRLLVEIPANFQEMQRSDPPLARLWRMHTREIFQTYLTRGYRVVDFFLSGASGRGHYLLAIPA